MLLDYPFSLLSFSLCRMTSSIGKLTRSPPSSSSRHNGLPLLIHLFIDAAAILSQSSAAESTSAAFRQTMYTAFQNVYATQLPLAIASETTMQKCAQLCLQIPSCSGFNYLRSPSKSGGPCDPSEDPKGSTCEFIAFENISGLTFAQGATPLCRSLYANVATTNEATTKGVTTNGATSKGATTNGVTTNGATTNGATTNGATTNEATTNGAMTIGATTKGAMPIGAMHIGATTKGFTINGATTNGVMTSVVSIGLNPCLSSPCQNLGVCVKSLNSYFCNCTQATTGKNCESTCMYTP